MKSAVINNETAWSRLSLTGSLCPSEIKETVIKIRRLMILCTNLFHLFDWFAKVIQMGYSVAMVKGLIAIRSRVPRFKLPGYDRCLDCPLLCASLVVVCGGM